MKAKCFVDRTGANFMAVEKPRKKKPVKKKLAVKKIINQTFES
jgi:hypothetical protein